MMPLVLHVRNPFFFRFWIAIGLRIAKYVQFVLTMAIVFLLAKVRFLTFFSALWMILSTKHVLTTLNFFLHFVFLERIFTSICQINHFNDLEPPVSNHVRPVYLRQGDRFNAIR